eukprot:SAG31_NODE_3160_length_4608_cov_1.972943_2_plen_80_part_00
MFFTATPRVYMPNFKVKNIVKLKGKLDWRVIDTDSVYDDTRWGFQPVWTVKLIEADAVAPQDDADPLVKVSRTCCSSNI